MFLNLILCISTHSYNKIASVAKTASWLAMWQITLLHTTQCMQYFQGLLLFKVPIKKKKNNNWTGHWHIGSHTCALKVSSGLSQSLGPGILGLGQSGEKLLLFLPGWKVSEKSHKSETGDGCFKPESNTEYSLPPQESILFMSLWHYLVSNLFPAFKKKTN